jgi:hypothetical protein
VKSRAEQFSLIVQLHWMQLKVIKAACEYSESELLSTMLTLNAVEGVRQASAALMAQTLADLLPS